MRKVHHEARGGAGGIDFDRDVSIGSEKTAHVILSAFKDRLPNRSGDDYADLLDSAVAKAQMKNRFKARRANAERLKESARRISPKEHVQGEAFETLMNVVADHADWFGGDVFPTEMHDDVRNGVDAVVEWESEDGVSFKLAIDYTVGSDPARIGPKFKDHSTGTKVDFFLSSYDNDPVQELNSLPRVLLGIDERMLPKVALPIFDTTKRRDVEDPNPDVQRTISAPDVSKKAYVGHPMQLILLDQAEYQLNYLVREEAAKVLKKVLATYTDQKTISAIKNAIETGQQREEAEWIVDVVSGILRKFEDSGARSPIGELQTAKWRNWTGVWNKVREKREEVLKNMSRPAQKTARAWEGKSDLHQLLLQAAA